MKLKNVVERMKLIIHMEGLSYSETDRLLSWSKGYTSDLIRKGGDPRFSKIKRDFLPFLLLYTTINIELATQKQ